METALGIRAGTLGTKGEGKGKIWGEGKGEDRGEGRREGRSSNTII